MSAIPQTPAKTAVSPELDPVDLYAVRSMLSEEERLVQDAVAKFVDEQVIPIIGECFEHERFPRELVSGVAELGLLGSSIQGYGCAGLNGVSYGLICQELERGDSGLRSFVSVQSSLCMYPDLRIRQRRAEAALAAAHGQRRSDRLLRADRAARRFRSGEHEDSCAQAGQGLGAERGQDVDHQRLHRRSGDRLGAHG